MTPLITPYEPPSRSLKSCRRTRDERLCRVSGEGRRAPQPQLNPKPKTLNLKLQTLNAKPKNLNPKPKSPMWPCALRISGTGPEEVKRPCQGCFRLFLGRVLGLRDEVGTETKQPVSRSNPTLLQQNEPRIPLIWWLDLLTVEILLF